MVLRQTYPTAAYKLVIFDFDGTLADSFPFFVSTINHLADMHFFKKIHLDEVESLRELGPRELMKTLEVPVWKLGVSQHSIYKWLKAVQPLRNNADEHELLEAKKEILRLKSQLKQTEEERDILK